MIATLTTKIWPLLRRTIQEWQEDNCLQLGTSLAYVALFSLFPLMLVILSIFGAVLGANLDARQQVLNLVNQALPSQNLAFDAVQSTLDNLSQNSAGAGIIGFITLIFSASGVFGALNQAFDVIWRVKPPKDQAGGIVATVFTIMRQRAFSFALVLGCAFLVLLAFVANIAIGIFTRFISSYTAGFVEEAFLLRLAQIGVSFGILTLVLMLLFKYLPNVRVSWGDVWPGALITAGLFVLLQQFISMFGISLGSNYQAYGAVGGVMALLLWIYLTSQILFLGGEFTFVYAHMFGSYRTTPAAAAFWSQAQPAPADSNSPAPTTALVPAQPLTPTRNARPTPPTDEHTIAAAGIGALVGVLSVFTIGIGALVIGIQRAVRRIRGGK